MSPAKTRYRARRLADVAEGAMYGAGEEITGPFDPKHPHNAALIERGAVRALPPRSAGGRKKGSADKGGADSTPSIEDDQ